MRLPPRALALARIELAKRPRPKRPRKKVPTVAEQATRRVELARIAERHASSLSFVVPGPPVPKARARVGDDERARTPWKTKNYERKIRSHASAARGLLGSTWPCVEGRYALRIVVWRDIDRGDLSNFLKSAEDALNRVVYPDDRMLCRIESEWGNADGIDRENPRIEVCVEWLGLRERDAV